MTPDSPAARAFCLFLLIAAAVTVPARTALAAPPVVPDTTAAQKSMLIQMQDAFTHIAEAVEPTVVNIKSEQMRPADSAAGEPGAARPARSTGSGVIVRSDGYILTNDHVVEGASGGRVTVTLSDGREFSGRVYPDFKSDLAVVKIDPGSTPLPTAAFGDASSVRPGQWAVAVGSPFDLQNTMTVGIISAVGRHQNIGAGAAARYYPDLLQTDAAINPGNSGGPLFDVGGKVIGINVAIESPVEGSAGVGFAIPIGMAQQVMAALIDTGHVTRGYLGLAPEDLTPAMQTQFGQKTGAFVRDVSVNSPAGKAGLQAADIVTAWAGKPILGEITLRQQISATPPGKTVQVSYVRDGVFGTVPVTMGTSPTLPSDAPIPAPSASKALPQFGLTVRNQTARDRQTLGLPPGTPGVVIVTVAAGSPAEAAGLSADLLAGGAYLQKLGHHAITSKADFAQAAAAVPAGSAVTLIVLYVASNQVHQTALTLHP